MNRLILIGNGFDLAHGLKTSYKHFIDDFWIKKLIIFTDCLKTNSLKRMPNIDYGNFDVYNYSDKEITVNVIDYQRIMQNAAIIEEETGFKTFNSYIYNFRPNAHQNNYKFNNQFLGQITNKQQLEKWVDIEEEYYTSLLSCLQNRKNITNLNENFHQIQIALQAYLSEQLEKNIVINRSIEEKMYSPLLQSDFIEDIGKHFLEKIYFLNFNYTPTIDLYSSYRKNVKTINIHGLLNNYNNPIIFGYGDEMDDNYKNIEKEENEFLQYVKSFKYSKTNNYKELLTFINSGMYQIYIMGLSCGTSDRTLLNTLFEHKHCKSIKIYYFKKNNVENNFLDIYMNISRCFNNKEKMREIVVSFENSVPLSD